MRAGAGMPSLRGGCSFSGVTVQRCAEPMVLLCWFCSDVCISCSHMLCCAVREEAQVEPRLPGAEVLPSNACFVEDDQLWRWASWLDLNTCLSYNIPCTAGGPSDRRDRGRVRVNPALGHGPGRKGAQGHQDHRPVVRAAELSCPGGGCCGRGWRTVLSWSAAGCPGSPPWAVHLVLPCVLTRLGGIVVGTA